jgi:hypothetical protein
MMILSGTKTLTASLAAAPATTQPTFVVAYAEVNAAAVTEDTNEVTATGTTPVTVLSSPAAGLRRVIKSLFVTNLDTVPTTVTVFINGFPAGKATIGSGLSVDLASSTAIPVSQGQVATGTLMGNNSGVSNFPFALSATASLTLLGIPGLQTSGITGNLTLSKTGVTACTQTARDASGNLCLDSVDNAFTVAQTIDKGSGALPIATPLIRLGNVNATATSLGMFSFGARTVVEYYAADGTRATPTATSAAVGTINTTRFRGYDGTAWQLGATIDVVPDGTWSVANRGLCFVWSSTPNGSTTTAEWMRLQNGNLCIGGTPTAGNGLVQRTSGTTRANGDAWGTDTFIWRDAANSLITEGAFRSNNATSGIGYATGAGGTVTQVTSRTTGVTLNKITGAITLVSAAGSVAWQSFTVTNSAVAATDTIICNQVSGTDLNMIHVTAIAAGSFRISFATTAGVTVEQPVFRFTVIKSVSA